MFQARHREKVTGEKFWKSSRRREERCLSPSPVPNCSKAVRFFPLSLSLFSKIKQQFKNFFQVRFSTGLTGEGGREGEGGDWGGQREKLLSRKISLGTVFYKSYGITFLSRAGLRGGARLNGKSFAFSEASSRAASNRGGGKERIGGVSIFKIENPPHPSVLNVKSSSSNEQTYIHRLINIDKFHTGYLFSQSFI